MNDDRISRLFKLAIETEGDDRERLLQSFVEDERHQIESLLAADQTADDLGLFESLSSDLAVPSVPARIRDYELLEVIGEGGMGTVYRAHHARLRCDVALKLLPVRKLRDPATVARFQREMEAVGKLRHPNIVQATDAGEENGVHYLVLEFVDGVDLSKILDTHDQVSVADACELIRQSALGLQNAHEHDLVHRDVKPSNFLVSKDGAVKVADMGLASLLSEGSDLTSSGQIMGTLDYIAPEQIESPSDVGAPSDLYSLGCTFYHVLCGRPPFASEDANKSPLSKIRAHEQAKADAITQFRDDVPAEVVNLVTELMAKNPTDRPESAAMVAERLAKFTTGADIGPLVATARSSGAAFASMKNPIRVGDQKTPEVSETIDKAGVTKTQPKSKRSRLPIIGLATVAMIALGWFVVQQNTTPPSHPAGTSPNITSDQEAGQANREALKRIFEMGMGNVGGVGVSGEQFYAKSASELPKASELQSCSNVQMALSNEWEKPTLIEDVVAELSASGLPLESFLNWGVAPTEDALKSLAAQPTLKRLMFFDPIDLRNLTKLPADSFSHLDVLMFSGPEQLSTNAARSLIDRFPNVTEIRLRTWDFEGVGELQRLPLERIALGRSQTRPNIKPMQEFTSVTTVVLGFSRLLPDPPRVDLKDLPPGIQHLDVQNITLSPSNLQQLLAYPDLESVTVRFSENLAHDAAPINESALAKFQSERPEITYDVGKPFAQ